MQHVARLDRPDHAHLIQAQAGDGAEPPEQAAAHGQALHHRERLHPARHEATEKGLRPFRLAEVEGLRIVQGRERHDGVAIDHRLADGDDVAKARGTSGRQGQDDIAPRMFAQAHGGAAGTPPKGATPRSNSMRRLGVECRSTLARSPPRALCIMAGLVTCDPLHHGLR